MIVVQAVNERQIVWSRELFEEYANWLDIDLEFQGFSAELAGLPGPYAPPRGRLLLATDGDEPVGCVAMRPIDCRVCEMKRLFVRPEFRLRGLGRQLVVQVIDEARMSGYVTMCLDTLPMMRSAIQLYESLGFQHCEAYYETPLEDTVFMELAL